MKTKGIKLTFIENSNIFNNEDFSIISDISQIPPIRDEIRYRSGNFAYINNEKIKNVSLTLPIKLEFLKNNKLKIIANKSFFSKKRLQNGIVKEYFDTNLWKAFLLGKEYENTSYSNLTKIQNGFFETFTDHYAAINTPFKLNERESSLNHGSLNFYNREFFYNFFSPNYESVTNRIETKEYTLPSFYSFKRYIKNKNISDFELAQISLGGEIQNSLYDYFFNANTLKEIKQNYFDEYGKKYDTERAKISIRENYSSADTILSFEEIRDYKDFKNCEFPFYCKLQFYSEEAKEILSSIKTSGLDSKLISDYVSKEGSGFLNFTISKETGENLNENIRVYDLKYWYNKTITDIINKNLSQKESFSLNYKIIDLANSLKKISNEKFRTLQEVYSGLPAHSEIFMYKIEKYFNNPKGQPLQTFYFFPSDTSIINFFDTQIKYGKNYAYKVYAVTAVMGNEYTFLNNYENLLNDEKFINDTENGEFIVNFENIPSLKLLEIPYFEFSGASVESPTYNPNAFFEVYQGKKDRIAIRGQAEILENYQEPIILETQDSNYYELLVKSQENKKEKTFAFDQKKIPKKIQIFRTTIKPNFYSDLGGKLHFTLPVNSAEFYLLDNIVPNVKYYYTFRFLNDHDNPSSPSDVYEFELRTEDQLAYPIFKKIDIKKKIFSQPVKKFRKYLQISATLPQTIINNSHEALQKIVLSNNIDNISLGINEKVVWDKLFKLRINSIKSGRKIDLNFRFIKNGQKIIPSLVSQYQTIDNSNYLNSKLNGIYVGIL